MSGIRYYVAGDTDVNDDIKKVNCDVVGHPADGKDFKDYVEIADGNIQVELRL